MSRDLKGAIGLEASEAIKVGREAQFKIEKLTMLKESAIQNATKFLERH